MTRSVAALDVVGPLTSVITTRYCAESSPETNVGVVYDAVSAPLPPETLAQDPPAGSRSH